MKYLPYPEYKPSGVDFYDEIPSHWGSASLRWISIRYAGGTPDKANESYWEGGSIPWLNSGSVNQTLITEPSAYITEDGFHGSSAKWIPRGALVMALAGQGKTKGMVAQLGIETTCNQSMAAIIPNQRIQSRFLFWWLTANYTNIRNLAGGEQRDGLNLEILGSIQCPLFPQPEQLAIATFLDYETAKIDTLIAKRQALIEKLQEKRSALISQTVTRGLPPEAARTAGLDPHPALKPSGVEWLGDVPEHWEIKKLRYTSNMKAGESIKVEMITEDGEYPVYGGNGLRGYTSGFTHEGDYVLIGRQGALCGNINYAKGRFWASEHAIVVRCNSNVSVDWLGETLRAMNLNQYSISAAQPGLAVDNIKSLSVGVPPHSEQNAIANYIDNETKKTNKLVSLEEEIIDRMQEYRSSLITAAVTGKIDVRGVSLPETHGAAGRAET